MPLVKSHNIQKKYSKIIVDLPNGLGDQVMGFPLLASIKKAWPDCKITILTSNKASNNLLKYNSNIDKVKYVEEKFTIKGLFHFLIHEWLPLYKYFRTEKFDLYVILHPNIYRTLLRKTMPIKSWIENREQTHKTKEAINLCKHLEIKPVIDYTLQIPNYREILAKFGLKDNGYVLLDLYPQYLEKDPRRWPHFSELIKLLKKNNFNVVTAGINRNHLTVNETTDLVNKTSFDELLALIKGASTAVTMDTGLFHFAYALGTPLVGLFGPVNPQERRPYETTSVETIYKTLPCSPCIKNRVDIPCGRKTEQYLCMDSISADEVMAKINYLQFDRCC